MPDFGRERRPCAIWCEIAPAAVRVLQLPVRTSGNMPLSDCDSNLFCEPADQLDHPDDLGVALADGVDLGFGHIQPFGLDARAQLAVVCEPGGAAPMLTFRRPL